MSPIGSSSGDDGTECPKCVQFIEKSEMLAFRVDSIKYDIDAVMRFLSENEWIFLENAENLKHIKNFDRDVDKEAFEQASRDIVRFNAYLDKVKRAISTINAEGSNFTRGD